jgi:hypothetical protein
MFNNLDIVQSKFGDCVRYDDIIMLMHESSQRFVKFDPDTKRLTLSNHDSEYSLFSIEPYCEIMINDNQILKSGQPIKLKVASFSYANKNLYFSLQFPYYAIEEKRSDNNVRALKENKDEEEEIYDRNVKLYTKHPEIIIEEDSNMKWRFNLFSTFTINEKLLVYGDFVNILHCDSNACLTIEHNVNKNYMLRNKSISIVEEYLKKHKSDEYEESDISIQSIGLNNNVENVEDFENIIIKEFQLDTSFYLKKFDIKDQNIDVNSTWIIENIFENVKNLSFVRFYDPAKLDTYRMAFRIKNYKSNKYLSLKKFDKNNVNFKQETWDKLGMIQGVDKSQIYKFVLIDADSDKKFEDKIISQAYQYSLFGFHPSFKTSPHSRVEKNQFLRIYHIATKSYLKILYQEDKKDDDSLMKCFITLTKNQDEQEVFKVISIDINTIWNFSFMNNIYYLFKTVIAHINENLYDNNRISIHEAGNNSHNHDGLVNIKYKMLKSLNFILDKLQKFITNQFINKFNPNYDFGGVVIDRQDLIDKFGFVNLILREFLYDFWIGYKNMSNLIELVKILRKLKINGNDYFSSFSKREKLIYKMSKYTDSFFNFLILLCKDNLSIKNSLYENLDVFFYFISIKESCVNCLIEMFKNNGRILYSVIRDCKSNLKFKSALANIYSTFFIKKESKLLSVNNEEIKFKNNEEDEGKNLIDLIIDYVKISSFSSEDDKIESETKDMLAISLISRDRYFEFLKTIAYMEDTGNILENQSFILERIVLEEKNEVTLLKFLERSKNELGYPPCLTELLVKLAENNHHSNIIQLIRANYKLEKLIYYEHLNDTDQNAISLKLMCYFIKLQTSGSGTKYDIKDFGDKIITYFISKIHFLEGLFTDDMKFRNNSLAKEVISIIQFIKTVYESKILKDDQEYKDNEYKLLTNLMNFLTYSKSTKKVSTTIQDAMNMKQIILKDRISKSSQSNYLTIANSWLNVYLVYKNKLSKVGNEDETASIGLNSSKTKHRKSFVKKSYKHKNKKGNLSYSQVEDSDFDEEMRFRDSNDEQKTLVTTRLDKKPGNSLILDKKGKIEEDKSTVKKGSLKKKQKIVKRESVMIITPKKKKPVEFNLEMVNYRKTRGELDRSDISITNDEEKLKYKNETIQNVLTLFNLFIKKNNDAMVENFINYYHTTPKFNDEMLPEFAKNCLPPLDTSPIAYYVDNYLEDEFKKYQLFSKVKIYNFNQFMFNKNNTKNNKFNFVHNLMLAFNITDDLDIQENVLKVLYNYFTQRKKFFKKMVNFNDHLLFSTNNVKGLEVFDHNSERLKSMVLDFYNFYERSKHQYRNENVAETEKFFTTLLVEISNLFRNILNFIKNELDNMSDHIGMDFSMIKDIDVFLEIFSNISEGNEKNIYDIITRFYYFIRKNSSNNIVASVGLILNQGIIAQYNSSLVKDFTTKGRHLMHKDNSHKFTESIRTTFFSCFSMLTVFWLISNQRNKKIISFFNKLLEGNSDIIYQEPHTCFLILIASSDLQKENFMLDYYQLMENVKIFTQKYKNIEYSIQFSNMYLDIIINVLKYVIQKDKIISETNLDEIVVHNIMTFFKRVNREYYQQEDGVMKMMKVMKILLRVESLLKIFKVKLSNRKEIITTFPKPDEIFDLFKKNVFLETKIPNVLNAHLILVYIFNYITHINPSYFKENISDEVLIVKYLIYTIFYGDSFLEEANQTSQDYIQTQHGMPKYDVNNDRLKDEKNFFEEITVCKSYSVFVAFAYSFVKDWATELNINKTLIYEHFVSTMGEFNSDLDNFNKIPPQEHEIYYLAIKKVKFMSKQDYFMFKEESFTKNLAVRKKHLMHTIKHSDINKAKDKCYMFKDMIIHNQSRIVKLVNNEATCFVFYLLNLIETRKDHEDLLYNFLAKAINFIYKSSFYKANQKTIKINKFLIFTITNFVSFYDEKTPTELNFLKKRTLKEVQIFFERSGIIEKCLKLLCHFHSPFIKELMPSIYSLFCILLKGGNDITQEAFFKNFTKIDENELIFKFIYNLIYEKMDLIITNKTNIIRAKMKKFKHVREIFFLNDSLSSQLDALILEFLQLLCENHNKKLQNFLRYQENFRKVYDLVSLTNIYLQSLFNNFEKQFFESLVNCFDLLIEFIQGPSLENQVALINSKLLITISDILSLYMKTTPDVKQNALNALSDSTGLLTKLIPSQVSLLAFKSSILLLALIEARTKTDPIYEQIIINIRPEILSQVYHKIYYEHMQKMNKETNETGRNILRMRDLDQAEEIEDYINDVMESDESSELRLSDYVIIETGFNLFFLHHYINDYLSKKGDNMDEGNIEAKKKSYLDFVSNRNIVYLFLVFVYDLIESIAQLVTYILSSVIFVLSFGKLRAFNLMTRILRKGVDKSNAVGFYRTYTKSIEILRDEVVYKIYFFIYPFLRNLKGVKHIYLFLVRKASFSRRNGQNKFKD